MTRKKKARNKAGRVPAEMMVELERDSHPSQNKLKPRQRSQYQQQQDKSKNSSSTASSGSARKSRLKSDPAKVANESQQLMDKKLQDNDNSD